MTGFVNSLSGLLVFVVYILPWAAGAGLVWLGVRLFRKKKTSSNKKIRI